MLIYHNKSITCRFSNINKIIKSHDGYIFLSKSIIFLLLKAPIEKEKYWNEVYDTAKKTINKVRNR